jgi:hypothetical protein
VGCCEYERSWGSFVITGWTRIAGLGRVLNCRVNFGIEDLEVWNRRIVANRELFIVWIVVVVEAWWGLREVGSTKLSYPGLSWQSLSTGGSAHLHLPDFTYIKFQ